MNRFCLYLRGSPTAADSSHRMAPLITSVRFWLSAVEPVSLRTRTRRRLWVRCRLYYIRQFRTVWERHSQVQRVGATRDGATFYCTMTYSNGAGSPFVSYLTAHAGTSGNNEYYTFGNGGAGGSGGGAGSESCSPPDGGQNGILGY